MRLSACSLACSFVTLANLISGSFDRLLVRSSLRLFVSLFVGFVCFCFRFAFVRLLVCSFVRLFDCSFVRLFVCAFARLAVFFADSLACWFDGFMLVGLSVDLSLLASEVRS